ncbi:DUF5011 domain-containing protein, partial [Enterococcus faecalis]|nr:DUF5011 domain-containing protein [Enterococcus faecalis]
NFSDEKDIHVNYLYQKEAKNVVIQWLDADKEGGDPSIYLKPSVVFSGEGKTRGNTYQSQAAKVPGYVLVGQSEPSNGNFSDEKDIHVNYLYLKEAKDIVVNHISESGVTLATQEIISGNGKTKHNDYETKPKNIPGYKVTKAPTNATGKYSGDESIVVNYVYERNGELAIQAEDKTIEEGSEYDLLSDVTASDMDGKDISKGIKVNKGKFDINKSGVYSVEYTVTKGSKEAKKIVTITVIPKKPSISPVSIDDTKVVVIGTPNREIELHLPDGAKVSKLTDANGKAEFSIAPLEEGKIIKAVEKGHDGTVSLFAESRVIKKSKGVVEAEAFYINHDTWLNGSISGDVKKVYLEVDGRQYTKIDVQEGAIKYYAKDKLTATSQVAKLVGLNSEGQIIAESAITLKDGTLLKASVTPETFVLGKDNFIKGKFTGAVDKVALKVNGTSYGKVSPVDVANFQYYAKDKIKNKTDKVTIVSYNKEGRIIVETEVVVKGADEISGQVITNKFSLLEDNYVKGTYTGDVKRIALEVNGTVYGQVNVQSDGSLQYYAKDKVKNLTDSVKIHGYNSAGVQVSTAEVELINARPVTAKMELQPFVVGTDLFAKGNYTGNIKMVAVEVNGVVYGKVNVVNGTNFQYYIKDKVRGLNDQVFVIGYNIAGDQVVKQKLSLAENPSNRGSIKTINDFYLGTDSFVKGQYTGEATSIALKIGDKTYQAVKVAGDGTFQYYAKDKVKTIDQVASIVLYNKDGRQVDERTISIKKEKTAVSVRLDKFVVGTTSWVTGIYAGDIVSISLTIDGKEYGKVPVTSSAGLKYYAKDKIVNKDQVVKVNGYSANNILLVSENLELE